MRLLLLPIALLASACIGLDSIKKDGDPGHDLDSADTSLDSGHPLDSAVDGNSAPIADAGDDQEAAVSRVADLDGTGSSDPDMDALSYSWEITEAPPDSAAGLVDDTQADPQLVPDLPGRYVVTLTVSDGALEDSDEVEITATSENGGPVANAGGDQSVPTGTTVNLDGSGSSDPEGDTLAYVWTLTSRPGGSVAALAGGTTATPSFVADVAGNYELSLTVNDGTSYSSADTLKVRASDPDTGGGSSSSCGCSSAPDALGASALVGIFLGLPLLGRRREKNVRRDEKNAPSA